MCTPPAASLPMPVVNSCIVGTGLEHRSAPIVKITHLTDKQATYKGAIDKNRSRMLGSMLHIRSYSIGPRRASGMRFPPAVSQ